MSGSPPPELDFLPRLTGFIEYLRGRGLVVGTGAALDCAEALRGIQLLDRETFLAACTATLAKSPEDVARIAAAFVEYWNRAAGTSKLGRPPTVQAPSSPPPDGLAPKHDPPRGLRLSIEQTGRVRIGLYSPDAPSAPHRLEPLPPSRIVAIRAGVRRLRRATATRTGRRTKPSRHGTIDFGDTARHSLRQGGEWLDFRFRKRARSRSEFFVLWDVSGSMKEHEAGLFGIVHALHRGNRRTRVFAFGTRLEEVTDRLRGTAYRSAAGHLADSLGPSGGGTRIGPCLEDFLRRHASLIDRRTTVVILSDGWDLDEASRVGSAMDRLRRRCHRIVWVNPYAGESRFEPSTAGMREALPYLDYLLSPADFELRYAFDPGRLSARRSALRAFLRGKAFIAS